MTEQLVPLRSKKQHSASLDVESIGGSVRPNLTKVSASPDTPRLKREQKVYFCAEHKPECSRT